jgi:hypothetical protein
MTRVQQPQGAPQQDSGHQRAMWMASNGIWYDAIIELGHTIGGDDEQAASARMLRARLLQQVGLTEIAQFELQEITP